jgi:hypothetical protein
VIHEPDGSVEEPKMAVVAIASAGLMLSTVPALAAEGGECASGRLPWQSKVQSTDVVNKGEHSWVLA